MVPLSLIRGFCCSSEPLPEGHSRRLRASVRVMPSYRDSEPQRNFSSTIRLIGRCFIWYVFGYGCMFLCSAVCFAKALSVRWIVCWVDGKRSGVVYGEATRREGETLLLVYFAV